MCLSSNVLKKRFVVAVMARFLQPGDDPVRVLVSLMADAGWDVREDPDWYNGEDAEKYL
jgi:hypothetical protein